MRVVGSKRIAAIDESQREILARIILMRWMLTWTILAPFLWLDSCAISFLSVATAKLILDDGRLQEFAYPVKASYVLQKNPSYFICNSDEMEFDDVVSAVSDDEELQPGQIYFALPLSRLKHRMHAEEMAALAVKASSALNKNGCGRNILVFPREGGVKLSRMVAQARNVRDGGSGKIVPKLRAIPE